MPLSTKRYFCGGCGAVVDGPGRYCREACVAIARAKVVAAPASSGGGRGRLRDDSPRVTINNYFAITNNGDPSRIARSIREAIASRPPGA